MIFKKDPRKLKERLQDTKKIKVLGMKFTIKKINPFIDFAPDDMPQIFTDFLSQRKPTTEPTQTDLIRVQKEVYKTVEVGVVEPELVRVEQGERKGKENGLTVEDLFRNPEMGYKLYNEILIHSLNRFKGIRSLFFSIKMRYLLFMALRKSMANSLSKSSSLMGITA